MSESLRDRVARVLYESWVRQQVGAEFPSFDDAHEFDRADHYVVADALIAAGLVAEPEWEYGFRKKDGGMSSPDARWRTPEQAGAWMITTDTLMRRANPEPGDWQEAPREAL